MLEDDFLDNGRRGRIRLNLFLIIVTVVFTYLVIDGRAKMKKFGVITIARAVRKEVAEQGGDLFLDVRFNGAWYRTKIDGGPGIEIDSLYFARVLSTDPEVVDELLGKVPSCVSVDSVPAKGWASVPVCTIRE